MSDRSLLIARKQEVRRQIERLQRQLAQLQSLGDEKLPLAKSSPRKARALEDQLERLMAIEMNLRLEIDRSR